MNNSGSKHFSKNALNKSTIKTSQRKKCGTGSYIIDIKEDELIMLAKLIQAEAEGEPMEGKIAVGAVVINRVLDSSFPETITQVILEHEQFESVINNRLFSIAEPNPECLKAACQALKGKDPTGGALFFFNPKLTSNEWLKKKDNQSSNWQPFFCQIKTLRILNYLFCTAFIGYR